MDMTLQTSAALARALPVTETTLLDDGSHMIQREGHHPAFRKRFVASDHSPLLQAMIRRRDELLTLSGEPDATGERLIELLTGLEMNDKPIRDAATDWLREVGLPEPDDFDTYDFAPDEDWRDARW